VQGTLFVAKSDEKGGPPEWEPFHFAHHADGAVSFRPAGGSLPRKASLPSGLTALPSHGEEELYLDADWRQPFIAAPWKPLSRGIDASQQLRVSKSKVDGSLFPFTLSYTPFQCKPGDDEPTSRRRMTVVLAATNPTLRSKWLASLSQKASSPALRPSEPPGPASMAPAAKLSDTLGGFPAAARLSLSSALRPPRRRFAALGEEHRGLPLDGASSSRGPMRLPAGPSGLWDMSSHLRVVRDLYDGYASDPLGAAPRMGRRLSSDSASDTISGSSTPSQPTMHRGKFLEKYVERQAEIENLLERKWGRRGEATWLSEAEAPETSSGMPAEAEAEEEIAGALQTDDRVVDGLEEFVLLRRPALAGKTKNVTLDGDILSNRQWSGGALLAPPDERSFRLTICALDPLETNPLFIGIAPADMDLGMVNVFSNEGVFLCMGGRASDSLISALGSPAGPAFYTSGERHPAPLPSPFPGQSLSVHFYTSEGKGSVRFIVSESTGEEVFSAEPMLKQTLSTGPWRPCVLLCMPDTRVLIQKLI